jgi:TonB family protein
MVLYQQTSAYCDKPDDAHYMEEHVMWRPRLLFDVHNNNFDNSSREINWSEGFKGEVPVCYIVDEKGNVGDIHLLHSLERPELERRIKEVVSGWRYEPAYYNGEAVKIQMLAKFFFN